MVETEGIWSGKFRSLTIGIILVVMAVAFEGLAVTTVAPKIANDLHGIELYGWIFSGYLLAQILGTMVVGQQIDKRGLAKPFTISLLLFIIGIVAGAIASNMTVLILARALQGFGSGALVTCVYTSISVSYPDRLRSRMLAVFSSAYVLPALVGPYVAGVVAQHISWRFVFWGILPFLLLAAVLTLPVFLRLTGTGNQQSTGNARAWLALALTIGTGLLLSGLGMLPQIVGIVLSAVGLLIMVIPLLRLLPKGTFRARSGLPAILASRGLFMACYVAMETYLVLALTEVKGYATDMAGLIVASAALSWSAAAAIQARLDVRDQGKGRRTRVLVGVLLMLVGMSINVWVPSINLFLALAGQIIAGFGIGLAHPTSGAIAFRYAEPGSEGEVSASLQFADAFTPGVVVGLGGAILAIFHSLGTSQEISISAVLGLQVVIILLSLVAAFRLSRGSGRPSSAS